MISNVVNILFVYIFGQVLPLLDIGKRSSEIQEQGKVIREI